jgi:hypothetical protein
MISRCDPFHNVVVDEFHLPLVHHSPYSHISPSCTRVLRPSYCAIIHNDSANAYLYLPVNHVTIIQYISIVNNAYFTQKAHPLADVPILAPIMPSML